MSESGTKHHHEKGLSDDASTRGIPSQKAVTNGSKSDYKTNQTQLLHTISGSIVAGCFSTLLGHPLDTIKVHQQTKPAFSNANVWEVAKRLTWDGKNGRNVQRLFRGIGPPMANQMVMNTVMFTVFDSFKTNAGLYLDETSAAFWSGLCAGFATACISTPTDWIKIQAQTSILTGTKNNISPSSKNASVMSILKREFVSAEDGRIRWKDATKTLYRGHLANLGREGVFTMVYLGLYDRISHVVRQRQDENGDGVDMASVVLISSFTGACAWLCNYPFDTIKSVQQASNRNVLLTTAVRQIYQSGGFLGFFRGAGPSTLRAMMVTSSRMLAYEKTIQLLKVYE